MNKLKHILFSFSLVILFNAIVIAGESQYPAQKNNAVAKGGAAKSVNISDTSGNNIGVDLSKIDTLDQTVPVKDPKQEFKNLFTNAFGDAEGKARLNPMAVSFVQNYITKNKKGMLAMRDWCTPHFLLMDAILTAHGVPKELKYLAVIESGLRYNAISFAGAVGPWAFMPAAARQYGLRMGNTFDERLDLATS